jgi:hypothetical protein
MDKKTEEKSGDRKSLIDASIVAAVVVRPFQGDQIGRIFARSVVVSFIHFWKFTQKRNFCFFHSPSYFCIEFDKTWIGLRFGRHFYKLVWSPWTLLFSGTNKRSDASASG